MLHRGEGLSTFFFSDRPEAAEIEQTNFVMEPRKEPRWLSNQSSTTHTGGTPKI